MHKINKNETPSVLNKLIKEPVHKYPTKRTEFNFSLKATKYSVSYCGPKTWNEFLTKNEKAF